MTNERTLAELDSIPHHLRAAACHPPRWHPLSSAQRGLWLAYSSRPDTQGNFNLSVSMRMRPAVEPERLQRALQQLASNHPMLRARFREIDGQPMQMISATALVPLRVVEVANLDSPEVTALERADRMRALDLATEPPFKASLYRAGAQECVMCLVFDHLACDGWSLFQVTQELGEILETDATRDTAPATAAPAGFVDYVAHEREWLGGRRAAKQLERWRDTFSQARPGVELQSDVRPDAARESRASLVRLLPADLSAALNDLSARHGTTMFVTLMAAYVLLLHRVSGQDDVSIGSVMPTRGERWKRTVGNFVNPVVMPVKLTSDMTIAKLLKSIHELSFRTLKNKEYPFDELIARLQPEGSQRSDAYLRTCFAFQKARHAQHMAPIIGRCKMLGPVSWGGFEVEAFGDHITSGFAQQDLKLESLDFGERLCVSWSYDAGRFSHSTIEALAERWEVLLRAMIDDPGEPVSRLSWLTADERRRLVVDWNAASTKAWDERYVHEQFEAHAERTPRALALHYEGEAMSYAELNARANRLAAYLRSMGLRPDARVAVCMERSFELIVALLATLKAGGAFVPLDPAYPAERLAHMLHDSAPLVVLTSGAAHTSVAKLAPQLRFVNLDTDHGAWAEASSANASASSSRLSPRNLAYVIYTSGSTGTPKGVMNEHRGLSNLVAAQAELFGVDQSSRILQFASPSFDASVSEIALALTQGASLHLAKRAGLMPGRSLLETLARGRITHVTLPPAALPLCDDREVPFTATTLIVAGEAIRPSEASKWASRVRLFNAYGPSEAAVCATVHRCVEGASIVPIGRPIANTRIYILDHARQPVPVGMIGEIYIGGVPVGRGYLNRPELTAERFVIDPYGGDSDRRMYKTGDLGRWLPDGSVEYLGRNDFQVKLRGFRIELGEVIARLSALEGISDVIVVAREDEPGDKRLVAYYCGADAPEAEVLRAHAAAGLPEYMVPAAYVRLDAFPITPNGKVNRNALPAPGQHAYVTQRYEAPSGRLERAVAQIWADVLKRERIGRHDDFFELGGHSLKAVEVISRLQCDLDIKAPLRALFSHTTLTTFAAAIGVPHSARTTQSNLVRLRARGGMRPLFGVHPIGGTVEYLRLLTSHFEPQLPVYGLEASGWDAGDAPASSIPGLAARYVEAIRSVQPRGPYRLLGYSVGGVIAYAMAEVLLAHGESVEFLGIIDSHPNLGMLPEYIELVERIDRTEHEQGPEAADLMFLQHALKYLVPTHSASAVESTLRGKRGSSIQNALEHHRLDLSQVKMSADPSIMHNAIRGMRATMKGLCHYRPPRLPLIATLFSATHEVTYDIVAEWNTIMSNRVHTVPIRGSHLSIMEAHNIAELAHAITTRLSSERTFRPRTLVMQPSSRSVGESIQT
jgi:amino acid adenylation domain-containing protein